MPTLPPPPELGLLAGDIGRLLVFVGIAAFLISAIAWIRSRERMGARMFLVGVCSVMAVFAIHVALLMFRQYEYAYVFNNTRNQMPEIYRFSAAWAAQEGSFLLWALTSSVFAAWVARATGVYRRWFTVICAVVLAAILGIIAYESPFRHTPLAPDLLATLPQGQTTVLPPDGRGLNPLLQNYWMAIHPWVIFIGFGSLLAFFAWSVSAGLSKERLAWLNQVRQYAIFSTTILGLGLTMGGLWAYETLGWGGFWAWDPVENVSLVPFLSMVAFVHAVFVGRFRQTFIKWLPLLGMIPFFTFVYGTYLTRSGALVGVSVHSFAKMNEGAHGLLLALVCVTLLSTIVFAGITLKKPLENVNAQPPGPRGYGIYIGVAILYFIAIMAAIGMSVPFFAALLGGQGKIVEESNYNHIVVWPFIPALLLLSVVPFLGWKKTSPQRLSQIANAFFLAVMLLGITVFLLVRSGLTLDGTERMNPLHLILFFFLIFICAFAIASNVYLIIDRIVQRRPVGPFVMHAGVVVLLLGLIVSKAFEKKSIVGVPVGSGAVLEAGPASYLATLDDLNEQNLFDPANSLHENRLEIKMVDLSPKRKDLTFRPVLYYTTPLNPEEPSTPVARPYIHMSPLFDLYLAVGPPEPWFTKDINLKPGESKEVNGVKIKYLEATRQGEPGQTGTRFGAKLEITYSGKTYPVHPEIELGGPHGLKRHGDRAGPDLIAVMTGMQAESSNAVISLARTAPIVPMELFFKPLASLVWLGTGIMTLGGFLSMRSRKQIKPSEFHASDSTS